MEGKKYSFTPAPRPVTKCSECPYCYAASTFGNDGRDGVTVYICKNGAFGKMSDPTSYYSGYASSGLSKLEVSKGIVPLCPMIQATLEERLAYEFGITEEKLKESLKKLDCKIVKN